MHGLLFFKEPFVINKIIGAFLIIASNILVFIKKGSFKFDKYLILGIIANLCYAIAQFIDVNNSEEFNLPFYVAMTLIIPALLIFIFERIKIKEVVSEFKNGNKKVMLATSLCWGIMITAGLRAYQLENVSIVAPLLSLTVILNVIVGYFFLKEKDNMLKKIIAALMIIIGIVLIKI